MISTLGIRAEPYPDWVNRELHRDRCPGSLVGWTGNDGNGSVLVNYHMTPE